MRDEVLQHLHDIQQAAMAVKAFVAGLTFDDYVANDMVRSSVERKFEIIGEALRRIKRDDPGLIHQIRKHRDIISFRNILVHGYDAIDDRIVWDVIVEELDQLLEDVDRLMR